MTKPMIVVSSDGHVGPRLVEDLRQYCPKDYLESYDAYVAHTSASAQRSFEDLELYDPAFQSTETSIIAHVVRSKINLATAGHYDPEVRVREMDEDGVAAEALFHGSANGQPFPFMPAVEFLSQYDNIDLETLAVGYEIYNRWLADFVAAAPDRFVGAMYLPMWDVELAAGQVERWAAAGLKGVNLPAPRGGVREYDDPAWEPFWSVVEANDLSLHTHGGLPPNPTSGPQMFSVLYLEAAGWGCRRGMHRLIFGGVFERHPKLYLTLTEQTRCWWSQTMRDLEFAYGQTTTKELRAQVPKRPGEYMRSNVFIGASFMPPLETDEALEEGYWPNIVWGRDYPHGEGTYKYPEADDEPNMTRLCYRWAYSHAPEDKVRAMLGENGVRAYHLDAAAMEAIAARIGPTPEEVAEPLVEYPPRWNDDIFTDAVAR